MTCTDCHTGRYVWGHRKKNAAMADSSKRESVDIITLKSAKITQRKAG